jgi:transketolase
VNTIKGLAMDAVQAANSGHPGMPMGMADTAYVLWTQFLKHDPADPHWPDRDRFVLSAGHGSMLLYSLLHLTGYDLSLDELKKFRQWDSRTPGHPEVGHTAGVETTTGPLGQGFANGVGMALGERYLREHFGRALCDHWVYAIVSDGDLMEGISSEAASIAGHLKLGRLVYLYDDNSITIDGSTDLSFTEDRAKRFEAFGWHVQTVDGHNHEQLSAAITAAKAVEDRPSMVVCKSHIGHSSPNFEDSEKSHGAPLGEAEIRLTKEGLGMDPDAHFAIPADVLAHMRASVDAHAEEHRAWDARLTESARKDEWGTWHAAPDLSAVEWPAFPADAKGVASRKSSHKVLNAVAAAVPQILGGSADLAGSNGSMLTGEAGIGPESFTGRNLFFGVREHAMASICNGMALHGGTVPYCATFLVFHDYMRPAVRLAGLMGQQVIYLYTHDSIYLGEDGPTHQPIEHLMAMRLIPNLHVIRPADANETAEAWKMALARTDGPTALALSRQNLPTLDREVLASASGTANGAYILAEAEGDHALTLIASGSEVSLALAARDVLQAAGTGTRVVSMPCWEVFAAQDAGSRTAVLGSAPRVSVEAGTTQGWERWVGDNGASVGVDRFGASAPGNVVGEQLGFSVDNVVAVARSVLI